MFESIQPAARTPLNSIMSRIVPPQTNERAKSCELNTSKDLSPRFGSCLAAVMRVTKYAPLLYRPSLICIKQSGANIRSSASGSQWVKLRPGSGNCSEGPTQCYLLPM
jgi:hypothetical protein